MNNETKQFELTESEKAILNLIAEGMSSRTIAKVLYVSENTIETHRRNMMRKAGTPNMAALVRVAVKQGIVI